MSERDLEMVIEIANSDARRRDAHQVDPNWDYVYWCECERCMMVRIERRVSND